MIYFPTENSRDFFLPFTQKKNHHWLVSCSIQESSSPISKKMKLQTNMPCFEDNFLFLISRREEE